MKTGLFITIASVVLIAAACSPDLMVFKEGRGFFLGRDSNTKQEMLCASGEIDKILASSSLSKEIKDSLYKYSCSEERSGKKVKQIFASMTVEQRRDIRNAFKINGYDINAASGCCAN